MDYHHSQGMKDGKLANGAQIRNMELLVHIAPLMLPEDEWNVLLVHSVTSV